MNFWAIHLAHHQTAVNVVLLVDVFQLFLCTLNFLAEGDSPESVLLCSRFTVLTVEQLAVISD